MEGWWVLEKDLGPGKGVKSPAEIVCSSQIRGEVQKKDGHIFEIYINMSLSPTVSKWGSLELVTLGLSFYIYTWKGLE